MIYQAKPLKMSEKNEHDRIEAEIDRTELSSDPFAAAMRATRMPMIITDPHQPDNPIVFVNNAFITLTGYAREDVIDRNCRFLQGPETDDDSVAKIREAIVHRVPVEVEIANHKKSGEAFWNRLLVSPVFDDQGDLIYFFASQFDITQTRSAHRALHDKSIELQALNDTLERRVAEAVHEKLRTEDELRQAQKMEAIGQLTGGVAHDFNNLLTVIRGSTDLLRRPNLPEERRKRYIDAISDTADRAAKLTSQLLAFARQQSLKPERFDAVESLRAVRDMIGTLTGSRIRITLDLHAEPCFVSADRSQFDTAIVNMAVNARDAMNAEGNLTIKVDVSPVIPAMRSHQPVDGSFVTIALTDTGTGIAADKIDRIFEPFFTTKSVGEGTGLGLSQVSGFAKQSGGNIRVESVEGSGTTFTMYLPLVNAPKDTESDNPTSWTPSTGEGACILVVEDNPEVGEFATTALNELGYRSVLALNASRALAQPASDSGGFDAVFTDVVMPGMSGIEMAKRIKELYPNLPVILTSGFSDVLAQEGTHGFDLLRKPYSIEELARTLRQATGNA